MSVCGLQGSRNIITSETTLISCPDQYPTDSLSDVGGVDGGLKDLHDWGYQEVEVVIQTGPA